MKIACLSLAPLFPKYVLGGSQNILNKIVLGLRSNGMQVRLFSPISDLEKSYIGDVEIENILNLKGSFPSPFEIPLYEMQDLSENIKNISLWADRLYLHGDGWIMRDEFKDVKIISGIHDLVYQEAIISVFSLDSNKIIVPSLYLLETIKASISKKRFENKNIVVIKNSISNINNNWSTKNKVNKKNLILLFPHRPDPRKGFMQALKIATGFSNIKRWDKVILKAPKFQNNLNKDEKNLEYLNSDVYQAFNDSGGELILHDWIPSHEMNNYYQTGDLTLCPGNFIESFGLVPLESLANQTPSVCSSVGAFRDLSNFPGIRLAPYNDIEKFVQYGLELLDQSNEIIMGRNKVLSDYSIDSMIKEYVDNILNPDKELNYKSNNIYYCKIDNIIYYLAPWCSIESSKIYHDYKGWMNEFEDNFIIEENEKIIMSNNFYEKAIEEKILISSLCINR
jgi:glycosyltransferase involved in cell wall biosynthesis|tara:strand:+ start:17623 stop:18978 length:1356 start_codon:yes stop_codon:yes gene_type:complete